MTEGPDELRSESSAEDTTGVNSLRQAEREVLQSIQSWTADQWRDLDGLIRAFIMIPRTKATVTDLTKTLAEWFEYRQAAALVWMLASGPAEEYGDEFKDCFVQIDRLRYRHGSFLKGAIALNTRGPDDWSELDIRFTKTSYQKPMVRLEVRLLDDRFLTIETTGTGYVRLVRSLADEIYSVLESTDAMEEDDDEVAEDLADAIKNLKRARRLAGE